MCVPFLYWPHPFLPLQTGCSSGCASNQAVLHSAKPIRNLGHAQRMEGLKFPCALSPTCLCAQQLAQSARDDPDLLIVGGGEHNLKVWPPLEQLKSHHPLQAAARLPSVSLPGKQQSLPAAPSCCAYLSLWGTACGALAAATQGVGLAHHVTELGQQTLGEIRGHRTPHAPPPPHVSPMHSACIYINSSTYSNLPCIVVGLFLVCTSFAVSF